jgi:hypothetical protein
MSACCVAASDRKTPTWVRRAREVMAWVVPSAILVWVPKCPACLAAYVTLWTGLGLSLSTATYLRWVLLSLGVASLLFLIVLRLDRTGAIFRSLFPKAGLTIVGWVQPTETKPWETVGFTHPTNAATGPSGTDFHAFKKETEPCRTKS